MSGRIIEVYSEGANRIGLVEFDGKRRAIYLSLVPDAQVGDEVIFHAGFATECVRHAGEPSAAPPPAAARTRSRANLEAGGAYRLLSELEPPQLRKLIPIAEDKEYGAGQIIFPAGVTSSFLHLIVSGDVVLEAITHGEEQPVQTLHAGDAMGWSAIMGESLTHFQARALTQVSTVAFPGRELRAICESDTALGYGLMKRLVELAAERLDAMRLKLAEKPKALTAR